MKKIVINKCYGGFGLSVEAKKEIAKIGCSHSKWMDEDEYFFEDEDEEKRQMSTEICETVRENGKILVDEHHWSDEARACPVLVQVVEKLGERANGMYAELKIVEIPDGVEFKILDFDGIEIIVDKNRMWE